MKTMETETLPLVTSAMVDEAMRRGREAQALAFRHAVARFGHWVAQSMRALGPHYVPWFHDGSHTHA